MIKYQNSYAYYILYFFPWYFSVSNWLDFLLNIDKIEAHFTFLLKKKKKNENIFTC